MARKKKEMDQLTRIHMQQDKKDCFFGVGDVVRVKCADGFFFDGEILCVDIKKEGDKLHPIMDIKQLADTKVEVFGTASIWIDFITELEIIRFKGEKDAVPENVRYQLLCDYLDELWSIKGLPLLTPNEKRNLYLSIIGDAYTNWIDIQKNGDPIGFLIVGTHPNCHPDADFYIEEAYIKPAYRRKGHMYAAVSDYVKNHRGTYCLFIINRNEGAKQFWDYTFEKLGYLPCYLSDEYGAGDKFCTQYGFKPADSHE